VMRRRALPLITGLCVLMLFACALFGITHVTQPGPAPSIKRHFSVPAQVARKDAAKPASAAPPAPPPMGPTRVRIPSLGVTAPIVPRHLTHANHTFQIPADVHHVGIWANGGQIYGTGTVFLASHVNWVGQGNGAFYDIATARPGTLVELTGSTVVVTRWVVNGASQMPHATLPQTVFAGRSGPRELVLITCGGPYTAATHGYLDNTVIRAIPAS